MRTLDNAKRIARLVILAQDASDAGLGQRRRHQGG